jgi:hypothetical protein
MRNNFAVAFGVGLAAVAMLVGGILYMQRGDAIDLPGKILKVRTAPLDENSTIAVLDFRITNPSNILLEVLQVTVEMEDAAGKTATGSVIGETDARRVFEAVPALGPKFLTSLGMKQRIAPHTSGDYMVTVRFQAPVAQVDARKKFILHIDEADGKSFEYAER